MSPSDDPFDARPTADLLATDALLDRVGARAPTPGDLDDPLVAALALMAAEIDLDAVPVEDTRAALARVLPDAADPTARATDAPLAGEHDGVVIDLRDVDPLPPAGRDDLRRPRRRPRPVQTAPAVGAMAPPRSLPRMPAPGGPGGSRRPEGRRERKLRPMVAVAVALTAIVLGSGVSAAVTGGRSVNPLDGLQQVVAELTGGRTQDQLAAYKEARKHLEAAKAEALAHRDDKARVELDKISPLLDRLTDVDRDAIGKQVAAVKKQLDH